MRESGASKKIIFQKRSLQNMNTMPAIQYQGEYNAELSSTRMEALARKYLPKNDWVLAEQDWYYNLVMNHKVMNHKLYMLM